MEGSNKHHLLEKLSAEIPDHLVDIEKQQSIGTLLDKVSGDDLAQLRNQVAAWLQKSQDLDASDIDLGGYGGRGMIWYRIYGQKKADEEQSVFPVEHTDILIQSLLTERQRESLYNDRNLDFSYRIQWREGNLRFRGCAYFDFGRLALNFRRIAGSIYPFKNLEFHPNIARNLSLSYRKQGLVLVTGITGSGKSTTLDSIIDANNRSIEAHIVIIAQPIEQLHDSVRCLVRHREVGSDVPSFKDGAIQSLRQDPDIIVVGEMRDPDTIMTVLEITDSGHKVFSTLHTASATESIDRIVAECPKETQERVRGRMADVLNVIISQKLIPSLDGKRVLAKEVLLVTPPVRAAIKNNNIGEIYQMIAEGNFQGMTTLEQDLKRLVIQRKISLEEASNYANNKKRFQDLINNAA